MKTYDETALKDFVYFKKVNIFVPDTKHSFVPSRLAP